MTVCMQHRFIPLAVCLLLPLRVRKLQFPAGTTRCDPDPRFHQHIPSTIKGVLCGYQNSDKAGLMQEGFYWIRHNGRVQVAYYTDGETEDLQTGRIVRGIWYLTRGFDICDDGEAEVLQAHCRHLFDRHGNWRFALSLTRFNCGGSPCAAGQSG